jgi:hypothetical protein
VSQKPAAAVPPGIDGDLSRTIDDNGDGIVSIHGTAAAKKSRTRRFSSARDREDCESVLGIG